MKSYLVCFGFFTAQAFAVGGKDGRDPALLDFTASTEGFVKLAPVWACLRHSWEEEAASKFKFERTLPSSEI